MVHPPGGEVLLHGAAQTRLEVAHPQSVLLVDEGRGRLLVGPVGRHRRRGEGLGPVAEDDDVEQIRRLQIRQRRHQRPFTASSLPRCMLEEMSMTKVRLRGRGSPSLNSRSGGSHKA